VLLYHGTTEAVARLALKEGLKPRSVLGTQGNWDHTVTSNPDNVYLTNAYAAYFAYMATPDDEAVGDTLWGIVEVETDNLDIDAMLPDEDWLEQATRASSVPDDDEYEGLREAAEIEDPHARMRARTHWYREHLWAYGNRWGDSINGLGTAAHDSAIPPEAIERIAIFNPKKNRFIGSMALEPMISLLNYAFCGDKYRAHMEWFMGASVDPKRLVMGHWPHLPPEQQKAITEAVKDRSALEIVTNDLDISTYKP
jgi:hypothetical protein